MTQTSGGRRILSPFAFVAYGMGVAGAVMLVLAPFLPLARITLLDESIETRLAGGERVGVVLVGLVAATVTALARVRANPMWATGLILPGIVAIGWSGYYAFSRIPEMARLADSASLASGGMLFVFAGPVLLIGGMAAVLATHTHLTSR